MSITEDYVSFETAKFLKENGYDETCRAFWKDWNEQTMLYYCDRSQAFDWCNNSMLEKYNNNEETNIAAPTLQMAMKWLRETHNLHICIEPHSFSENNKPVGYECTYWFNGSFYYPYAQRNHPLEYKIWDTYEDAVIETIKYCLTEL